MASLNDFLRMRRPRRQQRPGYVSLPAFPSPPAPANPHAESPSAREPDAPATELATQQRAGHLYRLYAVMKAACDGRPIRKLSAQGGPFRLFLRATRAIEAFEARRQTPVDDRVFVLSVFAYYGRDTWPGMFCHTDVLTYYQRYERRTAHERVTEGRPDDQLVKKVARAWGLSVEEARQRFGPRRPAIPPGNVLSTMSTAHVSTQLVRRDMRRPSCVSVVPGTPRGRPERC
jgi:hypothetical protein